MHQAYYDSADKFNDYFSFMTSETSATSDVNYTYLGSDSEFKFIGTEVYYKIYNNVTTMTSVISKVDTYNSDSTNIAGAAEYLIDTQKYQTLNTSTGTVTPLVKVSGVNKYCYIRLMDIAGGTEEYQNAICIGTKAVTNSSDSSIETIYYPRRAINSDYGFNFNSDDDYNPLPKSGDDDVTYSSSATEEGKWYVDMYAISVGRDNSFSQSYSKALHLGSVTIDEDDYD